MAVTALEAGYGRHAYNRDPTPANPVVRVFPAIEWLTGHERPCWVRDTGEDVDMPLVAVFTPGVSHFCLDMSHNALCDVCKTRHSFRYDDFFGYVCTLCEITHPLRYKARGVNPWG
jgi:hypothetical protein